MNAASPDWHKIITYSSCVSQQERNAAPVCCSWISWLLANSWPSLRLRNSEFPSRFFRQFKSFSICLSQWRLSLTNNLLGSVPSGLLPSVSCSLLQLSTTSPFPHPNAEHSHHPIWLQTSVQPHSNPTASSVQQTAHIWINFFTNECGFLQKS